MEVLIRVGGLGITAGGSVIVEPIYNLKITERD
jgi:hypothetical protein